MYHSKQFCTAGDYGAGWFMQEQFSTMRSHQDQDGFDAMDRCCGCIDHSSDLYTDNCDGLQPSASIWTDSTGRTCNDYENEKLCEVKRTNMAIGARKLSLKVLLVS